MKPVQFMEVGDMPSYWNNYIIPGYKNPSLETVIHRMMNHCHSFSKKSPTINSPDAEGQRYSGRRSDGIHGGWAIHGQGFSWGCGFFLPVIFGFVLETVWKYLKFPLFSSPQQKSFMCEHLVVPTVRANKLIHNMAVHVSLPRKLVFDSDLFNGNWVVN